jgi:hypothetical protein
VEPKASGHAILARPPEFGSRPGGPMNGVLPRSQRRVRGRAECAVAACATRARPDAWLGAHGRHLVVADSSCHATAPRYLPGNRSYDPGPSRFRFRGDCERPSKRRAHARLGRHPRASVGGQQDDCLLGALRKSRPSRARVLSLVLCITLGCDRGGGRVRGVPTICPPTSCAEPGRRFWNQSSGRTLVARQVTYRRR